jgi:hypothetical protein
VEYFTLSHILFAWKDILRLMMCLYTSWLVCVKSVYVWRHGFTCTLPHMECLVPCHLYLIIQSFAAGRLPSTTAECTITLSVRTLVTVKDSYIMALQFWGILSGHYNTWSCTQRWQNMINIWFKHPEHCQARTCFTAEVQGLICILWGLTNWRWN